MTFMQGREPSVLLRLMQGVEPQSPRQTKVQKKNFNEKRINKFLYSYIISLILFYNYKYLPIFVNVCNFM